MIKRLLLLVSVFLLTISNTFSQDLDSLLEAELNKNKEKEVIEATFKATRIVLAQSVENTAKGELNFIISHHFGIPALGSRPIIYPVWI